MKKYPKVKTVETFNEAKIKEKGSVFIGQVYPLNVDDEPGEILSTVRKKYYDATHHCFAYKLLDGSIKYSDDGEPNGTAGIRILNAIDHFNLISVLVIVIRYFGGTKLGIGPLGKAYYNAAEACLKDASCLIKMPYYKVSIVAQFDSLSHVHRILSGKDAKILDTIYKEDATFICLISPNEIDDVKFKLKELSSGDISFKIDKKLIYY